MPSPSTSAARAPASASSRRAGSSSSPAGRVAVVMVVRDVQDDGDPRPQAHERAVRLVRLDHDVAPRAAARARRRAAATIRRRRTSGRRRALEDERDHAARGRLAVRAGDRDPLARRDDLGEEVGPGGAREPEPAGLDELGLVAGRHRKSRRSMPRSQVARIVAEPVSPRRESQPDDDPPRTLRRDGARRDAAHAAAADAEQVEPARHAASRAPASRMSSSATAAAASGGPRRACAADMRASRRARRAGRRPRAEPGGIELAVEHDDGAARAARSGRRSGPGGRPSRRG